MSTKAPASAKEVPGPKARKDARQRQGSPEATAQQHQQLTVPVMQVTDCPPTQT
jgi:hypothetical protein